MPELRGDEDNWFAEAPEGPAFEPEETSLATQTNYAVRRFVCLGLTAAAAAGVAAYVTHKIDKTSAGPTAKVVYRQPEGCPSISASEAAKIQRIVRLPANPLVTSLSDKYKHSAVSYQATPAFESIAAEAARRDNLTLVNSQPYRRLMERFLYRHKTIAELKTLNQLTEKYGFSVDIPTRTHKTDDMKPIPRSHIGYFEYGQVLLDFAGALRYLPVEEIKATGLHEVQFVENFNNGLYAQPYSPADAFGSVIQIGVPEVFGRDIRPTLYHELGHVEDDHYCGNFGFNYYDPAFTGFNPPNFNYGVGGPWRYATVSKYGASNMREDKAELLSQMLGGLDRTDVHSSYAAVRAKYRLLLGRLDSRVPGIARYLAEISP